MGIFSKLSKAFDQRIETSDNHSESLLRTHYYKTSKNPLFKVCFELAEGHPALKVMNHSEERGEITAELTDKKGGLIVITVIPVQPFHTAVDLTISFDKGFQLAYGKKLVSEIYEQLDSRIPVSQKI